MLRAQLTLDTKREDFFFWKEMRWYAPKLHYTYEACSATTFRDEYWPILATLDHQRFVTKAQTIVVPERQSFALTFTHDVTN